MPGKIDTPLNKILEQVEWGEFELWILFEKIKVNGLKYKTSSLPSTPNQEYNLPALTAWIQNQWLNNYVPREWATILKNVISISANWANTWATFYQKKEFTVLQDSYTIRWIYDDHALSDNQSLFFVSLISKTIYWKYERTNKAWWERIKKDKIHVPIKDWKIDFDFMDNFIAELEKNYLKEEKYLSDREINAYLQVTWLKDYELTGDELNLLKDFEEGKFEWKEFKIWWDNGLFTINSSKKKFDANKVNILDYWKPYVVRTANNNWLRWYLDEDEQFLNDWNTISFGQDTATMFYQEKPYFTWDKIKIIKSKDNKFDKSNTHFFITSMWKAFSTFSRWQSSFNVKIIEKQKILLPVLIDQPDYELMKTFITAIKKLVIKDVVVYNQERLNATAEVINN